MQRDRSGDSELRVNQTCKKKSSALNPKFSVLSLFLNKLLDLTPDIKPPL